ncbi:MAG: hypothetical protein ACFFDT_13310, partial [Candidatus Hodarchaeota archaeon]
MSVLADEFLIMILEQLEGTETAQVAQVLMGKESLTDDEIAQQLEVPIKVVRRALYRLHASNLARFHRTRDTETGYFEFHWTLAKKRLQDLILKKRSKIIQLLKQRLSFEDKQLLYGCDNPECAPMPFEKSFELGFVCPTCNQPLNQLENEDVIALLRAKISELEEQLHWGLEELK